MSVKDDSRGSLEPRIPSELYTLNNTYHTTEEVVPPLPPRTQFLITNSYESITGPYVKVDEERTPSPPPLTAPTGRCPSEEDYDDIGNGNHSQDGEDYDDVG